MKSQQQNPLEESIASLRYLWRHRQGMNVLGRRYDSLRLFGRTVHLDHQIPGLILDTFDNLGFVTKDGRKPVLCAKRRTAYGWHLVFNLPPGISFNKVKKVREYFQDAANSWINLSWDGKLHMDVYAGQLPSSVLYEWNAGPYLGKMNLPVPIGVNQEGMAVLDLAESPHLLIAGVTGYGKSNFLHTLIASLLPFSIVCIIDLKRLEFAHLKKHCLLARNEQEAAAVLGALNFEMERRINILEAARVVKIQDYHSGDVNKMIELPFIVLVVDELAEMKNDKTLDLLDRLVRLARALGISIVAATQRPSTKVISGDTRSMFAARVCFQMADEISSRIVLGENCPQAAWLPGIKGRAIYKFGLNEKEVQTMFLHPDRAGELIGNIQVRRWTYEQPAENKQPAKRLLPR